MREFHIPVSWPVFILEDTAERITWFRSRLLHATFAKTADDAIRILRQQRFRVMFLDHDLHWLHADPGIFKGTGKEVARFLAEADYEAIVVIHSKNDDGVAAMRRYLPNAKIARFGEFEIVAE